MLRSTTLLLALLFMPLPLFATDLASLQTLASQLGLSIPERAGGKLVPPFVIAHRGASGYLPEHTLEAYGLAALLGADFIEPDLVMTGDGHLIARHDNQLDLTTDVADRPEFAARRRTSEIDGEPVEGWFSEDFTLAEIRQLRARERIPRVRPANTRFDGQFRIPTLEEIIALVRDLEQQLGREIGIYPELKHPTHFAKLGLAMEQPLVEILHQHGYRGADAPIFIQSFEVRNLQQLRQLTELPLIQLLGEPDARPYDEVAAGGSLTYAAMASPAGLLHIAGYANGVGPDKSYVLARDGKNRLPADGQHDFVENAHAAGLAVHPYTFRAENVFLPANLQSGTDEAERGDLAAELARYLEAGIDGFFIDHPDLGVGVKNLWQAR